MLFKNSNWIVVEISTFSHVHQWRTNNVACYIYFAHCPWIFLRKFLYCMLFVLKQHPMSTVVQKRRRRKKHTKTKKKERQTNVLVKIRNITRNFLTLNWIKMNAFSEKKTLIHSSSEQQLHTICSWKFLTKQRVGTINYEQDLLTANS